MKILAYILILATQRPRYKVRARRDFNWSKDCWGYNAFRLFELIFGAPLYKDAQGNWSSVVRQFSASMVVEHGLISYSNYTCYTIEAKMIHMEGILREVLKRMLSYRLVIAPLAILDTGFSHIPVGYSFQIASDASAKGTQVSTASLTISQVVGAGSNTILFGGGWMSDGDDISSETYNGSALTAINKVLKSGSTQWGYLRYILAPTSGTHNYVVNATGSQARIEGACVSYSGATQSGQPDASTTNTGASVATLTTSVTTVANGSWAVLWDNDNWNPVVAGTHSTLLQDNHGAGDSALFDNSVFGSITPAGSFSMTITTSGAAANIAVNMASFSPLSFITANTSNFLIFM